MNTQTTPSSTDTSAEPKATPAASAPSTKKSNSTMIIIIVVIALLLCCCISGLIGWFLFANGNGADVLTQTTPTPTVTSTTTPGGRDNTPTPTRSTGTSTPTSPQGTDDSDQAPAGFSWATCSNINSMFLKPDGWYKLEENSSSNANTKACFLSREQISGGSEYKVGMSVNQVSNISKSTNQKASEYAYSYISALDRAYETVERIQTIGNGSSVKGYGRFVATSKGTYPKKQYLLAVGYDSQDRLYMINFEAPASEWDAAWQKGYQMIMNLGLEQP